MLHRGLFLIFTLTALALLLPASHAQTPTDQDEAFLKKAGLPTDDQGLLQFFRFRTLKDEDRKKMEDWVNQLGSEKFKEREAAQKELLIRGPLSLPFLKEILKTAPLETSRRAELLIKRIETALGPEQPIAVARLLAARQVPGAIDTLLHYLPYANDDWMEEEILTSLGDLTIRGPKVDPLLLKGLKDSFAGRRGAAVYILGRRGDLNQRETVRQLLADPDPFVRQRAGFGLVGKAIPQNLADTARADEELLKKNGFKDTTEPALLDILRKRTLSEDDQKRLQRLVHDLGDATYKVRNKASKLLIAEGTPAIAFLRPALEDKDTELSRRAQLCLEEIKRGPGPAIPTAAIRLLARPAPPKEYSPAAAIRVLLDYVPFADDEMVEEEVLSSLSVLCVREVKIDPLLPLALADPLPARRAAAAHVLGKVGVKEQMAALTKALDDPSAAVRYRAALGLIAAKDVSAVPRLIAQIPDAPPAGLWSIEDTLTRLAGDQAPLDALGLGGPDSRQKGLKAWDKWWQANGSKVDLARLQDGGGFLGLYTICEYDSAIGQINGQVLETGRGGNLRWKFGGVVGAMDAQALPNGRILVAENSANRVTERDQQGNVKWTFQTPGNPIACQRLPNGNTFIATYNHVMEITPSQQVVYQTQRGPQFYIFSARKTPAGNVLAMTAVVN